MPTPSASSDSDTESSTSGTQALVSCYQIKLANKWGRIGLTLSTLPERWWQQPQQMLLASSIPAINDLLRGLMVAPAQTALAIATAKAPPNALLKVVGFQRDLPKLRRSAEHNHNVIDAIAERASDDSEGYKSAEHTGDIIHSYEDCYDEEEICRYRELQCQCDHIEITETSAAAYGAKPPQALCAQAFEWQPSEMGVQFLLDCDEAAVVDASWQREPLEIADVAENDVDDNAASSGNESEQGNEESEENAINAQLQKMQQLCKQELLFTLIKRRHQLLEQQEQERLSKNCALVYADPPENVQIEDKTLKECHEAGNLSELYDKAEAIFKKERNEKKNVLELNKGDKMPEELVEEKKVHVPHMDRIAEQKHEQQLAALADVMPEALNAPPPANFEQIVGAVKVPATKRGLLEAIAKAQSSTNFCMSEHDMYLETSFPADIEDDDDSSAELSSN